MQVGIVLHQATKFFRMTRNGIKNFHALAFKLRCHRVGCHRPVQLGQHHAHCAQSAAAHALRTLFPPVVEFAHRNGREHRHTPLSKRIGSPCAAAHQQAAVRTIDNQIGLHRRNHIQLLFTKRKNRIDVQPFFFQRTHQGGDMFFVGILHIDIARQQHHSWRRGFIPTLLFVESLIVFVGGKELVFSHMKKVIGRHFHHRFVSMIKKFLTVYFLADIVKKAAIVAVGSVVEQVEQIPSRSRIERMKSRIFAPRGKHRNTLGFGRFNRLHTFGA